MASEGLVLKTILMTRRTTSIVRSLVTSEQIVLIFRRKDKIKEAFKRITSGTNSRKVAWQHGMNLITRMDQTNMREK